MATNFKKLREEFLKKAKEKLFETTKRDDVALGQLIKVVEDLEKVINTLGERMEHWFIIYFPSLVIKDREALAKLILSIDKGFNIKEGDISEESYKVIKEWEKSNPFPEIREEILRDMKLLAGKYLEMRELKKMYEKDIDTIANSVAPNATALIGGKLVAKYLYLLGSLHEAAKTPASTLQVIGAEKALFKHLRNKKKVPSPKHGIILLSKYVSTLPKKLRGKMARTLSSKLAIAFKADLAKDDIKETLIKAVEERYKKLKEMAGKMKRERKGRK